MSGQQFIEKARALDKTATPGPWERVNTSDVFTSLGATVGSHTASDNDGWMIADANPDRTTTLENGEESELAWETVRANAEWIAASRSMLPAAVEALARVRGLHYRVTTCHLGDDAYCHHDGLAWPCMTIMATEVEA